MCVVVSLEYGYIIFLEIEVWRKRNVQTTK